MTTIKLRRDTSTNWTTVNPILAEGEVGIDTSKNYVKIGDGVTAWNSLPYATVPPEVLQVALDDKVDYFEVDSPLTDKWQVGSEAELSANASVSDSGILSDTDYGEYWALNNTTIENYIANQLSYWKVHFIFKTSTNNEVQPFFALADGAGEYDTNFIELNVTSGYFKTLNETTSISIPTNTWIEVDIEHIEGASNVSATINIEGTISTVSNVLDNNYTLSSAKGVEWLALGVTPFEFDITRNGFYVQNAPYSAKYCILTDRHLGVDLSSKQNVLTAGSNIQINGDTISATNTTYSAMTVSEGTTGTATTSRVMRADRLKSIIQGTKLTGLDTNYYTPITASDSILSALGKLQVGVDDANSMNHYVADDFIPDTPLTQYWENIGIDFADGVGEIDTDGILSSNTNDGWCNGQLPEMQSTNLINDYWEWSGIFRSANISSEVEIIAIDGVNDSGFLFHIKPNGDVINPDDNNKVLANVYFNDWVGFTVIHQAGETNITTTFDNAQGGTTTTITALATTSPQSISNVCWRLNVSPKIDYIVRTECYFRTEAGGIKYFFTKRHIGIDNKAFDGQWVSANSGNIISGSNITWASGHNYDLSSYLPNDGHIYEVIFQASWQGSTAGSNHTLRASTDIIASPWNWLGRAFGTDVAAGTCILPVGTGRYIKLTTEAKACNAVYFSALGYRRLGTNS